MNPILVQNHANYGQLLLSNHGFVTYLCKSDLRYNKHKLRKNNGNLSNFYHPFSQGVNSLNFPDPLRVPFSFSIISVTMELGQDAGEDWWRRIFI